MKKISYEKRIQMRITSAVTLMIIAFAMLVAILIWKDTLFSSSMLQSSYIGTGGGMLGASVVLLVRTLRIKNNPDKMAENQLVEVDERNLFIQRQTFSTFAYISIFLLYLAMIVAGLFSATVYYTLLTVLCTELLLVFFIRLYMGKQY